MFNLFSFTSNRWRAHWRLPTAAKRSLMGLPSRWLAVLSKPSSRLRTAVAQYAAGRQGPALASNPSCLGAMIVET